MNDVTDYTAPVACPGLIPDPYLGLDIAYQFFPCKMAPFILEMISEEENYKTALTTAETWMHLFADWSLHFLSPALPTVALSQSLGRLASQQWF